MFKSKDSCKSKTVRLTQLYTIKRDGAITLDLAKAAKSEVFKRSIREIRDRDLALKPAN